jgi:hypothetical protein
MFCIKIHDISVTRMHGIITKTSKNTYNSLSHPRINISCIPTVVSPPPIDSSEYMRRAISISTRCASIHVVAWLKDEQHWLLAVCAAALYWETFVDFLVVL